MSNVIVQYWPLWLIIFVLSFAFLCLIFFYNGLSILRGGRGSGGPFRVPMLPIIGAVGGGGLLVASIVIALS